MEDLICPWCKSSNIHNSSWVVEDQSPIHYYKRECLGCERSVCYSPNISPENVKVSFYAFDEEIPFYTFDGEATSRVTTEKELFMTYKGHINVASNETATAMRRNGFHDDDKFMAEVESILLERWSIDGSRDFWEIWIRNRKLARIALIHSELSEMVEGIRKDAMDDKLPHRKQEEVELADTLIRIEDYAGTYDLDLGGAREEKEAYNLSRLYKHGKKV